MSKDKNYSSGFHMDWFDVWRNQSSVFFESAQGHLNDFFNKESDHYLHPEAHMEQIQQWLEMLKKQWQFPHDQQKKEEAYWKTINKMVTDASDMMLSQWMKRMREDHPIKNIQELYELWLSCCHEVYMKMMR